MEDVRWQKREEGIFKREKLPGQFTAKKLFRWSDKRYDKEYWGRLERNWRWWKEEQARERKTLEMIQEEEEEIEQKNQKLENRQKKIKMKWTT